jgi:tetratricopeptide (TPR) repeat protein
MMGLGFIQTLRSARIRASLASVAVKQSRMSGRLIFLLSCIIIAPILICGCGHINEGFQEANDLFNQGSYKASLDKYQQIIEKNPSAGDRVLFEMGIIYAYPKNEQKDYQKSLECLQRLIKDYPGSAYRQNSEMMIFNLSNVSIKDKTITSQQTQILTLQKEVKNKENEIVELQQKVDALENKVFAHVLRNGSADKILIEKKARRLTLISKGEVLKTYKIALGGNPIGPKESQGDNKTPEGTYCIDAKNKDSHYHRSLHISYPNEKDKKRARALGVPPGGNIMIHGIKQGFSWVGDAHTEVDWTKGCIAVTDEEIEEIDKLAPNGTIVEIRP